MHRRGNAATAGGRFRTQREGQAVDEPTCLAVMGEVENALFRGIEMNPLAFTIDRKLRPVDPAVHHLDYQDRIPHAHLISAFTARGDCRVDLLLHRIEDIAGNKRVRA